MWQAAERPPTPQGDVSASALGFVLSIKEHCGEKRSTWDPAPLRPHPPAWLTGLGCLAEPEKPWVRSLTLPYGNYRKEQDVAQLQRLWADLLEICWSQCESLLSPWPKYSYWPPPSVFLLSHWGSAMTNWTMPASSCRLKMSSLQIF